MAIKVYPNAELHCEISYSHAVSRKGIFFCCFKVDDTYEDMRFICLRNDEFCDIWSNGRLNYNCSLQKFFEKVLLFQKDVV